MDSDFGDWYRAELEPTQELLKLRWNAIEEFVESASANDVLDLARVFHQMKPRVDDMMTRFRDSFTGHDSTFRNKGNDFEIALLAGSTLAHVLAGVGGDIATLAAYAMICPTLSGKRTTEASSDILRRPNEFIRSSSSSVRRPSLDASAKVTASKLKKPLKSLQTDWTPEALPTIGQQVTESLGMLVNSDTTLAEAINKVTHDLARFREDSNILWWVTGCHSRDTDQPLASLDPGCACIVVGKELADLTEFMPEPFSARAVLHAILEKASIDLSKKLAIASAVESLPSDWRETWTTPFRDSHLLDLCPMKYATLRSIESDGSDWHSAFKSATTVGATSRLDPVDLAMQVYRECLLLHAERKARE